MDPALLAPGYVELHLHTNFSLLDGASTHEETISRARELGYTALAATDHDNLFGAMAFARLCRDAGIQPITGVELTLAGNPDGGPRHHLTLLAATRQGYRNLCRLVSLANGHDLSHQAARERRRLSPCLPLERLEAHTEGLICLTGCRQGELSAAAAAGRHDQAAQVLQRWIAWFGAENVFVELQDNLVHGDRPRNRALAALARQAGVPLVATGDVHYHVPDRHRLQDAMVAIKSRTRLDEAHRVLRPNAEFYLRPPERQLKRFAEFPEAIASTRRIAERCRFDLNEDLGYQLPSPPVPEGETTDSHLEHLCREAIAARYPETERPAAIEKLETELELVKKIGLAGFFLVYNEVMELAKEVAREVRGSAPRAGAGLPPGRGRGSSVSSIICYLIGLSHIDPIRNRLFLGRFLNEEMHSLPDIDLDFPRDIRARLIERVYDRWGPDHAGLVATFPTYRIRSAIRDLGKVLGLPLRELDRLAKLSEGYGSARNLRQEMERDPQFMGLIDKPGWKELIELAYELAGFPRHMSQHVGGMVISSSPLIDHVPVQPAAWPGRYLCHWDKDSIDDARMVKIDFLALGMLSLVEECVDSIAEQSGVAVDLSRIPYDDRQVYASIHQGDTIGVFQIESRAQSQMLVRTQPNCLDDLTVQVAIVRPGPIVGGAVNPYVRQRIAMRSDPSIEPEIPHECVREILSETYGVVLFQEQVVQVAEAMGGMTQAQAERFRRSLGRKDVGTTLAHYEGLFMAGAEARNVPREVATRMFENLKGFASFGFPKSHAAAFGLLAYQSAWLREHHRPEFYCALYNNWPMGFYPPMVFTNDARRHGVELLRPDVNLSLDRCTVEDGSVRLGLGSVKGIKDATARAIVEARELGPYFTLFDLLQRTGLRREAAENLILSGACAEFDLTRRELIWQLGLFSENLGQAPSSRTKNLPTQLQLPLPTAQDEAPWPEYNPYERMASDYRVLGLSPDAHPLPFLRPLSSFAGSLSTTRQVQAMAVERVVDIGGLVVCRQRPSTAAGIVFLLLEDEEGLMNVMLPADLYERRRLVVRSNSFLHVRGVLEAHAGKVPMLKAHTVDPLIDRTDLRMPEGKLWA